MKTPHRTSSVAATAALLLALNTGPAPQAADYAGTVLSQNPVAYWRFNETVASPPPNIVANSGTLGVAGNGYVVMDVGKGEPGLVGSAIRLVNVGKVTGYSGSKVDVPFNAALNPAAPFTVEFWAKPDGLGGYDATGSCPISCFNPSWYGGGNRSGWLFYLSPTGRWTLRMGLTSGYDVNLNAAASGNAQPNVWQHIVATFDGATARIYVNGTDLGSAPSGGNWKPNTQMALRIGGTPLHGSLAVATALPYVSASGIAGNRGFDGWVDEVAVYPTALSASTVAAHYVAATTNPAGYGAVVLADNPLGYWNMDEPAVTAPDPSTYPVAANSGSAGSAADGTNVWGVVAAQNGPAYAGFGPDNRACVFNGEAGNLSVGDAAALHFSGPITMMAWVKPGVKDFFRNIVAHGMDDHIQETFLRISRGNTTDGYGDGNYYEVGASDGDYGFFYDSAVIPVPEGDIGNWVFLAGTYDGSNWNLYRNGLQVASLPSGNGALDVTNVWSVGSRSNPSEAEGLFFGGGIDEPAIFNKALSAAQMNALYNAAQVPPVMTRALQVPASLVFKGSSVSLSVWAEGSPTLSYQWTSNNVPLGVTATNLTIDNLAVGNPTFAVEVQNSYGTATSSVSLTVVAAPPSIATPPQAVTRFAGSPFTFSVTAGGSTPLTYQWKRNNEVVPGATSAAYSGTAGSATEGTYVCTVTNEAGTVETTPVVLTVLAAPAGYGSVILADAPMAYWRLGETAGTAAGDYVGGHDGQYKNVTLGQVGYSSLDPDKAAAFAGTGSYVGNISGTEINFSGHVSFTIELWANGAAGQTDEATLIAKGIGSSGTTSTEQFAVDIVTGKYRFFTRGGNNELFAAEAAVGPNGTWQHVVAVYDDSEGINQMYVYVNGEQVGSGSTRFDGLRVSADPVSIGSKRLGNDPAYEGTFSGTIDEVAIYPVALNSEQIAAHYAVAYGATVRPFISVQPSSMTNYLTLPATFSVGAEGSMPLLYQWMKNGRDISGANGISHTIPNLAVGDAGDYSVRVSNVLGSTNSAAAKLTVLTPPTEAVALPGLVLHLPFDRNLTDSTGRENSGTAVQITATATNIGGAATYVTDGKLGQALHYETSTNVIDDKTYVLSSYVTLGKRPDLKFGSDVDFTVAYWIRLPQDYSGNDLPFFTDAVGSTFGSGFVFAPTYGQQTSPDPLWPGGWAMSLYGDAGGVGVYGEIGTINNGGWHHLVHVFDRSTDAVTYLDGVVAHYSRRAGTSVAAAGNVNVDQPATIGQDPTGKYGEVGSADIDDLGVWHKALSPLDAASLYMAGDNGHSFVNKIVEPPSITVQSQPDGSLRLQWDGGGTLQEADQVTGSYGDIPGAASPYPVTPTAAQKFYRVKL